MGTQQPSHSPALQHQCCHLWNCAQDSLSFPGRSLFDGFETTKVPFGLGCSGAWKGAEGMEGMCLSLLLSLSATCPLSQWHLHPKGSLKSQITASVSRLFAICFSQNFSMGSPPCKLLELREEHHGSLVPCPHK